MTFDGEGVVIPNEAGDQTWHWNHKAIHPHGQWISPISPDSREHRGLDLVHEVAHSHGGSTKKEGEKP